MAVCPKCGAYAEILADTCPRCRVVVSKYQGYLQSPDKRTEATPQAAPPKRRSGSRWLDKIKKHLRRIKR